MKAVHAVLLFAAITGAATCLFVRRYVLVHGALNWTDAQTYCRNHYEDLATINSLEELNMLNSNVGSCSSHRNWIGLRRSLQKTAYTEWSDGSKLEYAGLKISELAISDSDLCVSLANSVVAVENCSDGLSFICYTWLSGITVVQNKVSWEEALKYCRTHYNDLISLTTNNDLLVAKKMITSSQTPIVWTGLRYMDGSWFWVNQDPLGNLTSVPSCPIRPFHCGALKVGDYILENRNCNDEMTFACY